MLQDEDDRDEEEKDEDELTRSEDGVEHGEHGRRTWGTSEGDVESQLMSILLSTSQMRAWRDFSCSSREARRLILSLPYFSVEPAGG